MGSVFIFMESGEIAGFMLTSYTYSQGEDGLNHDILERRLIDLDVEEAVRTLCDRELLMTSDIPSVGVDQAH